MHEYNRGPSSLVEHALPAQFFAGGYRYFTGSLAYVLHRVSGIALLFFLFFHILSITKSQATPEAYDLMIRRMQEPDFKIGEILLFAGLVFHALNGIRILVVDFAVRRTTSHKRLFWGFAVLAIGLILAGTIPLVLHNNVRPIVQTEALPGGGK